MSFIGKTCLIVFHISVLIGCNRDIENICVPAENERKEIVKINFIGNTIDSIDWRPDGKLCNDYELDTIRTPLDVYEVTFNEAAECSCVFLNDIDPVYCAVPFQVDSSAYNLAENRWDILYAFSGDTIFHPPCGYMDILPSLRTSGRLLTDTEFVLQGTIGGNSYGLVFNEVNQEKQTMRFLGLGGIQAEGQAHGAAYTRKAGHIFYLGDQIHNYHIENNLMYLTKLDSTGGMVLIAQ